MKKILLTFVMGILTTVANAQNYDEDRFALSSFIERMITNEPFEGCRIVDDYDNSYLLSVVMLDKAKYANTMAMNRVAQVKSQRNVGEFFNGTVNVSEFVITTPKSKEKGGAADMVQTCEVIKTNSIGYAKLMQQLTAFDMDGGMRAFVYYKRVDKDAPRQ